MNGSFTSMRQYYLTYQDYHDIEATVPDVKAAAPVISRDDIRAVSDFFRAAGSCWAFRRISTRFATCRLTTAVG